MQLRPVFRFCATPRPIQVWCNSGACLYLVAAPAPAHILPNAPNVMQFRTNPHFPEDDAQPYVVRPQHRSHNSNKSCGFVATLDQHLALPWAVSKFKCVATPWNRNTSCKPNETICLPHRSVCICYAKPEQTHVCTIENILTLRATLAQMQICVQPLLIFI